MDDFKKEQRAIRERLIKFSRAINEGYSAKEASELANSSKGSVSKKPLKKQSIKIENKEKKGLFSFFKKKELFNEGDKKLLRHNNKKASLNKTKLLKDSKNQVSKDELKSQLARMRSLKNTNATKKVLKERKLERKLEDKKEAQTKKPFKLLNFFRKKPKSFLNINKKSTSKPTLKATVSKPLSKATSLEKNSKENGFESLEPAKSHIVILHDGLKTPKRVKEFTPKKALSLGEGDELLDVVPRYEDLSPACLLRVILSMVFATLFFGAAIYIRTQIYYQSRDIAHLRESESMLLQENKSLKRRLEGMKFQNQILDYLK